MRNRGVVAALAVLITVAACGVSQAGVATLDKGTIELTPAMGFTHDSYSSGGAGLYSFTILSADATLGYFISDHVEVLGGLRVNHQAFSEPGLGSVASTAIGFTGGVQYNFPSGGAVVPFLRSALGVVDNSRDVPETETTFIAPILQGGLRLLVGSSASVNYALGYQHLTNAAGSKNLSADTFAFEIGVSIFPRTHP